MLTAFYSDRSVYHWQIADSNQIVKVSSHLFHVGTIHDICIVRNNQSAYFPPGTFLTCGSDETIRVWSVDKELHSSSLPTNVLSNELRKILYLSQQGHTTLTEQHGKNFGGIMADALETTVGIRCLRLSYDGKHLSCGMRNGNIIVFEVMPDLKFKLLCDPIEAHEQEVRCLEYTDPSCKLVKF
jgi:WD40 repeat protein